MELTVHSIDMSAPLTELLATSTETDQYGLGRTLQAAGLVTGLALGLVVMVGYPLIGFLLLFLGVSLRGLWHSAGPLVVEAIPEDGLTQRISLPFTQLRFEATLRKNS